MFDHLEYHIWKCGENKSIVRFETWDKTRFAESKANANLIATAPLMYKELGKLEQVLRGLVGECVPGSGKAYFLCRCIYDIIELRKKARGEK